MLEASSGAVSMMTTSARARASSSRRRSASSCPPGGRALPTPIARTLGTSVSKTSDANGTGVSAARYSLTPAWPRRDGLRRRARRRSKLTTSTDRPLSPYAAARLAAVVVLPSPLPAEVIMITSDVVGAAVSVVAPGSAARLDRAPLWSSSINALRSVRYDSATAVSGCAETVMRRPRRRDQNGKRTISAITGRPKCSSAARRDRTLVSERSSRMANPKPRTSPTRAARAMRWALVRVPGTRSSRVPRSGATSVV